MQPQSASLAYSREGPYQPEDRDDLDLNGRFLFLDDIVCLILEQDPRGGRFLVRNTGVTLADNGDQICYFDFV